LFPIVLASVGIVAKLGPCPCAGRHCNGVGAGLAVYLGVAAIAIVSLATLVLAATMGGP
jgi:hypothetical protein